MGYLCTMERMNSLYLIFMFTELFLCFVPSVRSSSSSRLNQRITDANKRITDANERITNTEIRLDTVTHDVAVFRLDIRSIWEQLGQLNTSCHKNCGSSVDPAVEISKSEPSVKSDQEKRMFTAFKNEKQAVRNMFRRIDKNMTNIQEQILEDKRAFQQSRAHEMTELNKKISKIENSAKDFKSLDKKSKAALRKQERRIESLEKEMNRYKTALETRNEELIDVKLKLTEMAVFNEKVLNNLYKLKDCPSNWHKYSGSCYYFSTSASKTTWIEANKNCQKEGAHLVEYDGVDEVKFVLDLVLSTEKAWSDAKYAGFWAGGSDLDEEGVWVWSGSGRNMDTGFQNWHNQQPGKKGQPDNNGGNENCLVSCINLEGQWNDSWCKYLLRYVCEK